eukprot:764825-Hanusia_phi.AAC.2
MGLSDSLLNLLLLAGADRDSSSSDDLIVLLGQQLEAEGMSDGLVRLLEGRPPSPGVGAGKGGSSDGGGRGSGGKGLVGQGSTRGGGAGDDVWQGFFQLEESRESFTLAQMTGTSAETIALTLKVKGRRREEEEDESSLQVMRREFRCSFGEDVELKLKRMASSMAGGEEGEKEEESLERICRKLARDVKLRGNDNMTGAADYPAALFCYSFALLLCPELAPLAQQLLGNRSEVLLRLRRPREAARDALKAMGGEEEEEGKNSRRLRRAREMLATSKCE